MSFLLLYCFLLIINLRICEAVNRTTKNSANKTIPCRSNYFWDKGECKECLPGYFGMNCSVQCVHPYYGQHCRNTCHCNISDCDHVNGCQGNDSSEIKTVTMIRKSEVSSTQEKSENLTAQTQLYETLQEKSEYSTAQTELNDYQGNMKTDNIRIPFIIVGCVLIFLIVVNGLRWISKPIRKTGTFELTREDDDGTTIYLEINGIFEQESLSNTMCTTVTARSCTSLNEVEIRPPLPVRDAQ